MIDKKQNNLNSRISAVLKMHPVDWQQILRLLITEFDCTTGTLHFLDHRTSMLKLKAEEGIPPFLLPKISEIPIGKGMAGIAAERREAVEMCNLQTDTSGAARPAARETRVEGSVAVPMLFDGKLYGVFGIAKPVPYVFKKREVASLLALGAEMGKTIRAGG